MAEGPCETTQRRVKTFAAVDTRLINSVVVIGAAAGVTHYPSRRMMRLATVRPQGPCRHPPSMTGIDRDRDDQPLDHVAVSCPLVRQWAIWSGIF
jgi:hypothetical protein